MSVANTRVRQTTSRVMYSLHPPSLFAPLCLSRILFSRCWPSSFHSTEHTYNYPPSHWLTRKLYKSATAAGAASVRMHSQKLSMPASLSDTWFVDSVCLRYPHEEGRWLLAPDGFHGQYSLIIPRMLYPYLFDVSDTIADTADTLPAPTPTSSTPASRCYPHLHRHLSCHNFLLLLECLCSSFTITLAL